MTRETSPTANEPARAATPRLAMRAIEKRFGPTLALERVDLEVQAGELHALIGENGAGKSTLLKILAGALRPDAGEIELDGARFRPAGPSDARTAGIAMVHQELSLAPHLTVAENLLLGREPRVGPLVRARELRDAASAALKRVGRTDLGLDARVGDLSLADRQMVEIARGLAAHARVLVLDEPTTSLSAPDARRLFELLRELKAQGVAIVYVSHVLEDVFALADRYTVLRDGRAVATGAMAATSVDHVIRMMVGREISELYPRSTCEPGEVLVRVQGLRAERGVRSATLQVRRGEVLGIAGLNGAGKSELVRAIFGLEQVLSGELRVLALDGARDAAQRWRQGVGLLSEDRKRDGLALRRAVADNLVLPSCGKLARFGVLSPRAVDDAARPWVERLRIKCASVREPVAQLSGGNQQKIALARLLAADCDLLLLDEPTRGVDVGAKAEIYEWVDALVHRGERLRAAIVVSSHLPELFGICDLIAVMTRGALGLSRASDELDEHDVMLAATGGASA